MRENEGLTIFGAFLVGAGVGAVIALLYAPRSGKETRRMISRKAEDGADYIAAKGKEFRRQAEDFVEKGRETAERIAERSRSFAEKVGGVGA